MMNINQSNASEQAVNGELEALSSQELALVGGGIGETTL